MGHAFTLYSLSNLKWSVGIKWAKLSNKIGYQFTRPAEFYCDKTWFNEEDEQQWRRSQGKSKTGGETPVQFSHKTFTAPTITNDDKYATKDEKTGMDICQHALEGFF